MWNDKGDGDFLSRLFRRDKKSLFLLYPVALFEKLEADMSVKRCIIVLLLVSMSLPLVSCSSGGYKLDKTYRTALAEISSQTPKVFERFLDAYAEQYQACYDARKPIGNPEAFARFDEWQQDSEKNNHLGLDTIGIVTAFSALYKNIAHINDLVVTDSDGVVTAQSEAYYESSMANSKEIFDYLVEKFCK
jgi:hypothetical protein